MSAPTLALATPQAMVRASPTARILPLDALRGLALLWMALDHAAAFVHVSFQAETYGGQPAVLLSAAYWLTGLLTNIAAPAFWLLSGVSVALLEGSYRRAGSSEAELTRFLFIRAGVLAVFTLTLCDWAWTGKTPYTQVLLSLALSLALLNVVRRWPSVVLATVLMVIAVAYQWALPWIATNFSQSTNFATALLAGYSTLTRPAVEFSLWGWGPLMGAGYLLGRNLHRPMWQMPRMWALLGGGLLLAALALRAWGGFGDLAPREVGQPWYYFIVFSKQPPSLTFFAFNLGLAALVLAALYARPAWLERPPLAWVVGLGQVALFGFVAHLLIYSALGQLVRALALPAPGVVLAFATWALGLGMLLPLALAYRQARKRHRQSLLRYL
ncbi:MAG: acyltransferase family protein [Anaerolineales bacterium]